jgi:CheY-like chemotaxis protein
MLPYILMLENDPDDRYITEVFFREHSFDIPIHFNYSSTELFTSLEDCTNSGKPFPSLILLSMSSTPLNAIEVLKKLRASANYNHVPAVVLCGVADEQVIRDCYAAGANSFIVKPSGNAETNTKILNFLNYWFQTVELVS